MRGAIKTIRRFMLVNWFWFILGLIATKEAAYSAYYQRGGFAVGGEYLVLPAILIIATFGRAVIYTLAEFLEERRDTIERRTCKSYRRVSRQRGTNFRRRG